MDALKFLSQVNYALRGVDDDAPTIGTDDANYWLSILNRKKNEFYNNTKVLWDSSWDVVSPGTISVGDNNISLDINFIAPSNEVYIETVDGSKVYINVVSPRRRGSSQCVYITGITQKTVNFNNPVTADSNLVGGTLYVPGYYIPKDINLSVGASKVPLPDPYWGVLAVASEIAFNDLSYEDKASDLNTKANNLYSQLVRSNRRNVYGLPKPIPVVTKRIRGY